MEPIISFEAVDQKTINSIASSLSPIERMINRIGEIDIAAGAGVISNKSKCLWTKAGHRITFFYDCGTYIVGTSKEIDPAKPKT